MSHLGISRLRAPQPLVSKRQSHDLQHAPSARHSRMSTSDHHAAKGGLPIDGGHLSPAAGLPTDGGPACASAHGDTLPPREDSSDAAPTIGGLPIDGGHLSPAAGLPPAEPDLTPAASPHGPAGAGPGWLQRRRWARQRGWSRPSDVARLSSRLPGNGPWRRVGRAPSLALAQPLRGPPTPRPAVSFGSSDISGPKHKTLFHPSPTAAPSRAVVP